MKMDVRTIFLLVVSLQLNVANTQDTGLDNEQDTVAEDVGVHQLQRLVQLLSSTECSDLLSALSQSEENIISRLQQLSAERNQLGVPVRTKRDVSTAADGGRGCRESLTQWLLENGDTIYYDRLSRALHHIGRADVAIEVGKNINQEKALNLKRSVEYYYKYANSLMSPSTKRAKKNRRIKKRKVRDLDLGWRDLDLMVVRAPVPPYQKGPSVVALPIFLGILVGFIGTFLAGLSLLLISLYFFH